MDAFLIVIAVLLVLLTAGAFRITWWVAKVVRSIQEGVGAVTELLQGPWGVDRERRLIQLEELTDMLPRKWEEMVAASKRSEERARYHTRGALKELEERGFTSPGLESVAGELQLLDDPGGGEEELPPVRAPLEAGVEAGEEDWERETHRMKFGA